jgi:hypothetical protein
MTVSEPGPFAGSRMHVLDLVESRGGDFYTSLNALHWPTGVVVEPDDAWRTKGYVDPAEALLDRSCEPLLARKVSHRLRTWRLAVHSLVASGPNWDLAAPATFPDGHRGLVLIEAKAHVGELAGEMGGKRRSQSTNVANHARIGEAMAEAGAALGGASSRVRISRDICHQFSNRVAFAWRLAAEGVRTVLIYLGFTGDDEIGQRSDIIHTQ